MFFVNGKTVDVDGAYDAEMDTFLLSVIDVDPKDTLVVTLKGDLLATIDRSKETVFKFLNSFQMDSWDKAVRSITIGTRSKPGTVH